jgi:hypothetical protein
MIASIAPPLAHAGHGAATLMYLAPILIVIALYAVQRVRHHRRGIQPPPTPTRRLTPRPRLER